jgi:hypothetical protein
MNPKLLLALALVWSGLLAGWAFNARAQMVTNGSSGVLARDGDSPVARLVQVGDSNFPCDTSGWDDSDQPSGIIPTSHVQMKQALNLLTKFETNKSIDQLQCAMRAMELVWYPDIDRSTDPITARRQQAKMWLQLLAAIDQNLDPQFDSNDVPAVSLIPPPSGLLQLPSGADLKDIKDPVAHAQYEAALKQNEEKTARYNFQSGLRRIDLHASFDVEHFLKRFYTSTPADRKEIDGLLREAGLSAPRIQKLRASLKN